MSVLSKLLTILVFLTTALTARAQTRGPEASLDDLTKAYDSTKINLITDFSLGKRPPRDAKDLDAIKSSAEWHVYRLRVRLWQAQPNKLYIDVFKKFQGIQNVIVTPVNVSRNQAFQKRFSKELIVCLRDVLDKNTGEPQVMVTAALMLPELARGGQEEVSDFLAELVRDPNRHDAIKLYALRGLGEYFKANKFDDPNSPKVGPLADANRKERDAKRIQAVIDFLKRKPPLTADMNAEQVEAVRYVRREAVRALGQLHVPAVDVEVKTNKVLAPVAVALLGVLTTKNEGAELPPSLGERVDAAVALCHMKSARIGEYDPRVALPFIAAALADFATEYNGDYKNVILNPNQRGDKLGGLHPWQAHTHRFRSGLRELEKNTTDPAVNAKVKELATKADLLLTTTMARKLAVDQPSIDNLRTYAQSVFPKMTLAPVYRGVNDKEMAIPIE